MGLLSWLFGPGEQQWVLSENGNPTLIEGNRRLTVFPQDGGYKFCAARADRDDNDPYFSDPYLTEDDAKHAGQAYLNGRPSPHASLIENWQQQRTARARQHLVDTTARLAELARDAIDAKNVTALRRIETKANSTVKSMQISVDRSFHDGLAESDIAMAERLKSQAEQLVAAVHTKIAGFKAR